MISPKRAFGYEFWGRSGLGWTLEEQSHWYQQEAADSALSLPVLEE